MRELLNRALGCLLTSMALTILANPIVVLASEPQQSEHAVSPKAPKAVLSGQIVDDQGAPVVDARLQISPNFGGTFVRFQTDIGGHYSLDTVPQAGKYRLQIFSDRCVGLNGNSNDLVMELHPELPVIRNFTLKRACQIRIQTVDEQGLPVAGVRFCKPGRSDGRGLLSDQMGWITIGGIAPSKTQVQIGALHAKYAPARLMVTLNDPEAVVEHQLVMTPGIEIDGTVVCEDGKPAVGWHIVAKPGWWDFSSFSVGEQIYDDGTFLFPHIGPGPYNISVMIPIGSGLETPVPVMKNVDLSRQPNEQLKIRVNYPSPAAMVFIEGKIKFVEGVPKHAFSIETMSDHTPLGGRQYLQPGEDDFRLGPLPRGQYGLRVNSREIEAPDVIVSAPAKDLTIELKVRSPMALTGRVEFDNGEPVAGVRVRVKKVKTLRGPNIIGDQDWQTVYDPQGQFSVEIPGPGVYYVEANAPGFAISRSVDINTDTDRQNELRVKLVRARTLTGTVSNEDGQPIDGAAVITSEKYGFPLPNSFASLKPGSGTSTIAGRFQITDLNPGTGTLRIFHPDYAMAEVMDVEVKPDGKQEPLNIVLNRGGRITGHVYDDQGQPAIGVTLDFSDFRFRRSDSTAFATAVTDETGRYQVDHLPLSLISIQRQNESNVLGVVRQVVKLTNNASTVDFGGPTRISGRLLWNGVSAADRKLLLTGIDPIDGPFRALARTSAEGGFVFCGVPPGEYWIYHPHGSNEEEWIRAKFVRVDGTNVDLELIDQQLGTLTIRWPGAFSREFDRARIQLSYPDPFWVIGTRLGLARRLPGDDRTFEFDNLPVGTYDLTVTNAYGLGVRQPIKTSLEQRDATILLDNPRGTGAIRGSFDPDSVETDVPPHVELRSSDGRLFADLRVSDNWTFQFTELPKGDYYLSRSGRRDPDRLIEFSIRDNETKSLVISETTHQKKPAIGFGIRAFTSQGVVIVGAEVRVTGPDAAVVSQISLRHGDFAFVSTPGLYQISIQCPGYKTITQQVEIQPKSTKRAPPQYVDVTLVRLAE
ncbi:MAG: carboxypeptidase regulatory-like domain-containing protein [Planctomycetes bacterium]|nr:carboxypeptidase regulatory-like domain-containing protein [Planctomycetota bacterium]